MANNRQKRQERLTRQSQEDVPTAEALSTVPTNEPHDDQLAEDIADLRQRLMLVEQKAGLADSGLVSGDETNELDELVAVSVHGDPGFDRELVAGYIRDVYLSSLELLDRANNPDTEYELGYIENDTFLSVIRDWLNVTDVTLSAAGDYLDEVEHG